VRLQAHRIPVRSAEIRRQQHRHLRRNCTLLPHDGSRDGYRKSTDAGSEGILADIADVNKLNKQWHICFKWDARCATEGNLNLSDAG
jgi:hypothetical protein